MSNGEPQGDDLTAALAKWDALMKSEPSNPAGFLGALKVVARFKRLDLGIELSRVATEAFPDVAEIHAIAGRIAEMGRNHELADRFWQRAVALQPGNREYSMRAAMATVGLPKDRKDRMKLILERLNAHHTRYPEHIRAYIAHLDMLRTKSHEYQQAIDKSATWCARFPNDADLAIARIRIFESASRIEEALAETSSLRARLAPSDEIEALHVGLLSAAGRHDEAELASREAAARFAPSKSLMLEYAKIAMRRGEWSEAVRRLIVAVEAFPDNRYLAFELANARHRVVEPEPEDIVASAGRSTPLAGFESLGGSGLGCEFGMVQRQLGSDALGLLRWTRVSQPHIVAALATEFEGVGDEAHTELGYRRNSKNADDAEYMTFDKRYVMRSHTFIKAAELPHDRMFKQSCRRMQFLRRKMLEDLRAAEKIFVYRSEEDLSDAMIHELHRAVARYADNALLCVMRKTDINPPGTLRSLGRGVYAGYLAYLKNETDNVSDVAGWLSVCRQAEADWQQTRNNAKAA